MKKQRTDINRNLRNYADLRLTDMHLPRIKLRMPVLNRGEYKLYGLGVTENAVAAFAAAFYTAACFLKGNDKIISAFYLVSLILAACNVFFALFNNFVNGKLLSEELVVTVSAAVLLAFGSFSAAAAVMLGYRLLRLIETVLTKRRLAIRSRVEIPMPPKCRVETEEKTKKIRTERVLPGQLIVVKPGEVIPVDGVVIEGSGLLDTYIITGSEKDLSAEPQDKVFSGCTLVSGRLVIRADETYENSTANIISDILYSAPNYTSVKEKNAAKYRNIAECALLLIAVLVMLLPPLFLPHMHAELPAEENVNYWAIWVPRGALIMALSCIPVYAEALSFTFMGGIAAAAEQGIVITGNRILEKLSSIMTMAFNKTGTLTQTKYCVVDVVCDRLSEDELLSVAAAAEQFSEHPIAKAICETSRSYDEADINDADFEEIPSRGVSTHIKGHHILVGNAGLLDTNGIRCEIPKRGSIAVHVAVDGKYYGYIIMSNKPRDNAFDALEGLRRKKVSSLVMLTGDLSSAARKTALSLNMDMVKTELNEKTKLAAVDYLRTSMTGDNSFAYVTRQCESPELFRHSDIGVSVGAFGCRKALESADVLIMEDDLNRINDAVDIAQTVGSVQRLNFIALTLSKLIELGLIISGIAGAQALLAIELAAALFAAVNSWTVIFKKL